MIRCNNCGWFNPDTAKHCEMCEEELSGLPIENPVEQAAAEEPVTHPSNPMMQTVRLAPAEEAHKPSFSATVMDATAVLKSEEPVHCPKCRYPVFGFAETCPNCGASLKKAMEDKGVSAKPTPTVKDLVEEEPAKPEKPLEAPAQSSPFKGTVRENPVSGPQRKYAKATVREIPAELLEKEQPAEECWRLIPVESPDSETIVMKPGDIISIGNRRYKFLK